MKKVLTSILAAIMLVALLAVPAVPARAEDTGIGINPGDTMPEFTVTTTEGSEVKLSELLKDHDLVILNLFASWCGPCEKEFPEMEKVYQANKDKMEIVALTVDPNDTQELIANYKAEHKLTFPVGYKADGLSFITGSSIPVNIFIDKSGMVGRVQVGAFQSEAEFAEAVDYFLSPSYDGTPVEFKKPFNPAPLVYAGLLLSILLTLVGRIVLFRKAGKKGWHAWIPFLADYDEFALAWIGWIGIAAALIGPLIGACNSNSLYVVSYALIALLYVLNIIEGIKLAKAFDKNVVFGILLAVPIVGGICRMILGFGKAQYQPELVTGERSA